MKSAIVFGPRDIRIVDEDFPVPGDNEVVAKVAYVGICGTDKAIYDGTIAYLATGQIKYPVRMGHEWSGTVHSVGKNVRAFQPSDRVCGDNVVTCGHCPNCVKGNYAFCSSLRAVGTVNTWPGAYTQYICMPEKHLFKLPDNVALDQAALIEPAATALNTAVNARIGAGDTVVVHGTGAIGFIAIQCARILGAARVIVTGRKQPKLDFALRMGAAHTLNWTNTDVTAQILALTDGEGADAVLETTGAAEVFKACVYQTKPSGTISVIGSYDKSVDGFDADTMVYKNLHMVGLNGSPHMYPRMIALLAAGSIDLSPFITNVAPLKDVASALESLSGDPARIKVLLALS